VFTTFRKITANLIIIQTKHFKLGKFANAFGQTALQIATLQIYLYNMGDMVNPVWEAPDVYRSTISSTLHH
jgi:hypothetical protein